MKAEVGARSLFAGGGADNRPTLPEQWLISESSVQHTKDTPAGTGRDKSSDLCL